MDALKEARIRAGIVAFLNFGHEPSEFKIGDPAWNIVERIVDAIDSVTTVNYKQGDVIRVQGLGGIDGKYSVIHVNEDGSVDVARVES